MPAKPERYKKNPPGFIDHRNRERLRYQKVRTLLDEVAFMVPCFAPKERVYTKIRRITLYCRYLDYCCTRLRGKSLRNFSEYELSIFNKSSYECCSPVPSDVPRETAQKRAVIHPHVVFLEPASQHEQNLSPCEQSPHLLSQEFSSTSCCSTEYDLDYNLPNNDSAVVPRTTVAEPVIIPASSLYEITVKDQTASDAGVCGSNCQSSVSSYDDNILEEGSWYSVDISKLLSGENIDASTENLVSTTDFMYENNKIHFPVEIKDRNLCEYPSFFDMNQSRIITKHKPERMENDVYILNSFTGEDKTDNSLEGSSLTSLESMVKSGGNVEDREYGRADPSAVSSDTSSCDNITILRYDECKLYLSDYENGDVFKISASTDLTKDQKIDRYERPLKRKNGDGFPSQKKILKDSSNTVVEKKVDATSLFAMRANDNYKENVSPTVKKPSVISYLFKDTVSWEEEEDNVIIH